MKVSASITDFPLHTSIETFFRELKNCGADGVELVLGAKSVWSFEKIKMLSKKYDLLITFDTTHANFISPQKEIIFKKIYPKIGNIHLSSFGPKMEHLPLNEGVFDAKDFIKYLIQQNYAGLLTLEINYYLFERFV